MEMDLLIRESNVILEETLLKWILKIERLKARDRKAHVMMLSVEAKENANLREILTNAHATLAETGR